MTLTELTAWKELEKQYAVMRTMHMRDMFAKNPKRFEEFSVSLKDFFLDYSKNRIDRRTMDMLVELAKETGVEAARDRMFSGEKINITEIFACLAYNISI